MIPAAAAVAGDDGNQGHGAGLGSGRTGAGQETTRTFATDAQRLCFSYDPKYIDYDKYLISASNRNGVAGNKFQLAGLMDPGVTVPYTLSLAGGDEPVALPSADGLPLTLGKSGRTCLTPTFKAWAGADIKGGISAMCSRLPLSPSPRRDVHDFEKEYP